MYGMYPYGMGMYNPYTFNYPLYGYAYRGLGGYGLYGLNGLYGMGGLGGLGLGYGLYGK
ncbi:unnamed protein product [Strongylus vulgaris]|uniref:Uncharacterized protein n=1 Tax=Strongylus vulgaris TaxID=40348 RepID=A0A3P7IK49_STRVU|nr:unnamed protein product [Strongylus vulgaris]